MEKVEQYIKEHTRSDSNELCSIESRIGKDFVSYREWLPLEQARKVAEIAREETINEVCEWIKKNVYSYTWCEFQQHERGVETGKLIEDLKKHLDARS